MPLVTRLVHTRAFNPISLLIQLHAAECAEHHLAQDG
jgi:hypothetical protein